MSRTASFTSCPGKLTRLGILAGSLLIGLAQTATAQTCLQQEYNLVNKQKLNCTANDVRVAAVSNVTDLSGNALPTCIEGSTFSFIATFNVVTTANAVNSGGRDNIGLYFQTDPSKPDALNGSCVDNIIYSGHPCDPTSAAAGTCGATTPGDYRENDPPPDNCGDTSSSVNGNISDRILVSGFKCTSANSAPCPQDPTKKCLVLPNCTSWQVPGSSIQCVASAQANFAYPFNNTGQPEAIPGSPSKCNCAVITLPIQPVNPQPMALKACNTPITSTAPAFSFDANNRPGTASQTTCDAGVEGVGTATYTVAVDNPNVSGSFGDIIVDQICDSAYGQIYPATGSCKAGSTGQTITSTTCTALDVPLDSAAGVYDSYKTCTFTAPSMGELNSVSNIVTVSGHSAASTGVTFSTQTNSVTVNSEDAPSTASVKKSYNATVAGCATVRYGVEVDNTSGADETETLSALTDSAFGSITSVQGSVLATTCSVPQTIAPGKNYTCTFDAQFCSSAGNDSGLDNMGCFSHSNQLTTVTLKGDETTDPSFNATSNILNVKECLSASTP